jgi:hypothetical protein
VQSAAYVARERYYDNRLGETFNYRFGSEDRNPLTESSPIAEASDHILREGRHAELGSRQEVLFSALYAPEGAPDWCRGAANIEKFWNAAETAERRSDAQIAERIIVALPKELTLERSVWALQDHIREFTRQGRVVQVAIHSPEPGHDDRNLHAHLLVSTRGVAEHGFKATKAADQQERFLRRREYVEHMRERWAQVANRHLARHGFEARLDHRSYQRQGIDREPEIHLGPGDAEKDRLGIHTLAGELNREIRARNAERQKSLDQAIEHRHAQPKAPPQPVGQVEPIEAVAKAHDRRQDREQENDETPAPALRHATGSFPASIDAAAANRALRATVEDVARELSRTYRQALEKVAELEKAVKEAERSEQNARSAGEAARQRQGDRRRQMGVLRRFAHDRSLWTDAELQKWQVEEQKAAHRGNRQGIALATVRDQLTAARWTAAAEEDAVHDRARRELDSRQDAAMERLEPRERLAVLQWADRNASGLVPADVFDIAREISLPYRRAAAAVKGLEGEMDRAEYAHKMAERDAVIARSRSDALRTGPRVSERELTNAPSVSLGADFNAQKRGIRVEAVREQLDTAQQRAGEEFEKVRPEAEKELGRRQSIAESARQQLTQIREAERLEQREKQQQRRGLRL